MQKQMRDVLIDVYLDMVNNYLTTERYAEHNGLTNEQAELLRYLANDVYNSDHPDA
jgi:hypothetical protein